MAQPPFGFGWGGTPAQPDYPQMGQTPYGVQQPYDQMNPSPYGAPIYAPPVGFGWQPQPMNMQPVPNNNACFGGYGDNAGIGFDCFPPAQSMAPSAPPSESSQMNPSFMNIPTASTIPQSTEAVEAGSKVIPISQHSGKDKPNRPSPPRSNVHSNNTSASSLRPHAASSASDEHSSRSTSPRYKEGLKNMADLMTDIDLTDDVLDAVKSRFNLAK